MPSNRPNSDKTREPKNGARDTAVSGADTGSGETMRVATRSKPDERTKPAKSAAIDTPAWDEAAARAVIEEAARRYVDGCRARLDPFIDRHFSLRGSLRLHRHAVGWDLLRAPYNVVAAVPQLAARILAAGGRRVKLTRPAAERLARLNLFLGTRVGREIGWLIMTELLRLPASDGKRVSETDAFAEEVMKDPDVARSVERVAAVLESHAGDKEFLGRLDEKLRVYTDTRAAAADMVAVLTMVGAGAGAMNQFTPGAMTLVPALSAALAQHLAISNFFLGSFLGSGYYALFPAAASPMLVAGTAGTVIAAAAVLTAFAGVLTDPLQRRMGLHKRRLDKLLKVLERELAGSIPERMALHDHYVARVLDLVDMLIMASRFGGR
ncbi:MAG: hypothetical protein OEQ29_17065 [Alphaproteobacteria bacterium]|nr:hypothetical protein [Alphaproteobacteria bacterium]